MRRPLSLLASGAAVAGLSAAFGAAPAAAELGCPDTHTPAPAALIRQGEKKDQNQNGVVCTKPTTCLQASGPICHGGPDDHIYGGPPLLGNDGTWYYVADDV
jgi:hypothetical protein